MSANTLNFTAFCTSGLYNAVASINKTQFAAITSITSAVLAAPHGDGAMLASGLRITTSGRLKPTQFTLGLIPNLLPSEIRRKALGISLITGKHKFPLYLIYEGSDKWANWVERPEEVR